MAKGRARFREAVISALLTARTLDEAAKQSGISRRTIQRWLADPDFAQAYAKAKAELVNFATGRLKSAMSKAVVVLEDVADAKDCPAAARVSAARVILEFAQDKGDTAAGQEVLRELLRESADEWRRGENGQG